MNDGRVLAFLGVLGVAGAAAVRRGSRGLVRAGRGLPDVALAPATVHLRRSLDDDPNRRNLAGRRPIWWTAEIWLDEIDLVLDSPRFEDRKSALKQAQWFSDKLGGAEIITVDQDTWETGEVLREAQPGAGIPVKVVVRDTPFGDGQGLFVAACFDNKWVLARGEGLDSDEEVSATIDRWFGQELAARLFREAKRMNEPPMGSQGIVRGARPPAVEDGSPTEGVFVPHRIEPSSILVGPTRFAGNQKLKKSEYLALSEADISQLAGAAMSHLKEGYQRLLGWSWKASQNDSRSRKPREWAFAFARWDAHPESSVHGYEVVVFRAVDGAGWRDDRNRLHKALAIARLTPGIAWLDRYSAKALNDPTGGESARQFLMDVVDRAWAKRTGSRGIVRAHAPDRFSVVLYDVDNDGNHAVWAGSFEDFLRDNELDEDEKKQVRHGEELMLGGGAAPLMCLRRHQPRTVARIRAMLDLKEGE